MLTAIGAFFKANLAKIGGSVGLIAAVALFAYIQGCNDRKSDEAEIVAAALKPVQDELAKVKEQYNKILYAPPKIDTVRIRIPGKPEAGTAPAEVVDSYEEEIARWKKKSETDSDLLYAALQAKQTKFRLSGPGMVNVVHYPWKQPLEQFQYWIDPDSMEIVKITEGKVIPLEVEVSIFEQWEFYAVTAVTVTASYFIGKEVEGRK